MKLKKLSLLGLTAITLSLLPVQGVLAAPHYNCLVTNDGIMPRFNNIQSASIGVYPSSTKTEYDLFIMGTSDMTSVSGTSTLYKKNASGTFTKIDSETINLNGSTIRYTGKLKSSGSGTYKITFSGKVYSKTGSETLTISSQNSY